MFTKIECYAIDQKIIDNKDNMAVQEGLKLNLFKEYQGLCHWNSDHSFSRGRKMLYGAVIKMILFDPMKADIKEVMDEKDTLLWNTIADEIKEAGRLLQQTDDLLDPFVFMFIPHFLHRDIEVHWDKIGLVTA